LTGYEHFICAILGGWRQYLPVEVKLPFNLQYNTNLFYQKSTSLHGEFYSSYYAKYPTSNFYNNSDPDEMTTN